MHYSDQELLQWLDGECDSSTAPEIESHLRSCWLCRARKEELENAVTGVARLVLVASKYPPERLEQARRRFAQRAARDIADPTPVPPPRYRWIPSMAAALTAAALMVAVWLGAPPKQQPPDPAAALKRTQQFELSTSLAISGTYVAELQIERTQPGRPSRIQQVRIAVDSRTGRRRVGHKDANTIVGAPTGSWWRMAADREERDLEAQVAHWIRSHAWEPILLSRNFNMFLERTGATLKIREIGRGTFLLIAVRDLSDGRWQVSMEVSAPEFRPVSLSVENDRTGGWKLRLLGFRRLADAEARLTFPPPVVPTRSETRPAAASSVPGFPAAELLNAIRVLHATGACTREQLDFQTSDATVRISITAATDERKRELAEALGALKAVSVQIRSPEDVATGVALPVIIHRAEGNDRRQREIPAATRLAQALGTTDGRMMIAWADRTVQLSERALAHATALRRIADAFDSQAVALLTGFQRDLLASILLDHSTALQLQLQALRSQLEQFTGGPVQPAAGLSTGQNDWRLELRTWTDAVRTLHAGIYSLFTIGGEPSPNLNLAQSIAEADRNSLAALDNLRTGEVRARSIRYR